MNVEKVVMPFDGKEVFAVRDQDGNVWVSVKRICENIGVDNARQQTKLLGDPKFSCRHMPTTGSDGKTYNMFCISLDDVRVWLITINSKKVKAELRDVLLAYQLKCRDILAAYFTPREDQDLASILSEVREIKQISLEANAKLDHLVGINLTVFGDDAPLVAELIPQAARAWNMTTLEYWGRVRKECDVSSYKLQNRRIINFIKNDIGIGIHSVKDTE